MRKYAERAAGMVLFFAILLGLLWGAGLIVRPKDVTSEAGMHDPLANGIFAEPDHTIDVLVLGDSETFSSVIPMRIWEETGYTTYVIGSPGQPILYTDQFLRRVLKHQSPKLVILETDNMFKGAAVSEFLQRRAEDLLPVLRYHDRWKHLTARDFDPRVDYRTTNEMKGYHFAGSWDVNPAGTDGYMAPSDDVRQVDSHTKLVLANMKKECEERGAKMVLISNPSVKNWNMAKHNGIAAVTAEMGIDYYDLNLTLGKNEIDWKTETRDNGDHLNYAGAKKATDWLAGYLASTGLLTDHRGDPQIADPWNRDLETFRMTTGGQ